MLIVIVVWNTRYMGLALDELRAAGMRIDGDDLERLSPLTHHEIHLYLDIFLNRVSKLCGGARPGFCGKAGIWLL